jgi:glycine cleavage system H protein
MKFSESHEWIVVDANQIATVGISHYAQNSLGDIVYVELPQVGKEVSAGDEAAVLESTKAAADVYTPVSGTIVDVNKLLNATSELINQSPEKEGWIFKIQLANPTELNSLMDRQAYELSLKNKH